MIDCRTYQVTNIRPLPGQALVELVPPPEMVGRIHRHPAFLNDERKPCREAIVRKLGEALPGKPFEVKLGDRVIISGYCGRQINQPPRTLKVVPADEVLAVFV